MSDYEKFTIQLKRLRSLKEFMTEDEYRFTYARIQARYLVQLFRSRGKRYTRQQIVDRVNIKLKENNMQTVSYQLIKNAIQ